jgi:hypothetical protein
MYIISGAFVFQPRGTLTLAGFQIALTAFNDDGSPVFPESGELSAEQLGAGIVLSYPQLREIVLLDVRGNSGGYGYVGATGTLYDPEQPPEGWIPAAMLLYVNESPIAVITAAAPAAADSGIEQIHILPPHPMPG